MKIIHCADLHLDSRMTRHLSGDKAKVRKAELLTTFQRMVAYGDAQEVAAILIAGDLFDTCKISVTARNCVLDQIRSHPEIAFFYLKGNHDRDNFLTDPSEIPDNLYGFGSAWTGYDLGDRVRITGMELNKENTGSAASSLVLEEGRFQIVMLHGQESRSVAKDQAEVIPLKAFKNKGIDYLALGHVHGYKFEKLDARASYCYPGCLEGRGFDECGEHGFVELDISEEDLSCSYRFVPFASRRIFAQQVDVSGCESTSDMIERTRKVLAEEEIRESDLVKVVLVGDLDVECEKDLTYLCTALGQDYYFLKVSDQTGLLVRYEEYLRDTSLKGEYVRQILSDESLSEEKKAALIRLGLKAIAGEEF